MTPKPDLYQLIRSLTKSEKRYFTLFANRHVIGERNQYLLLFHCIEKQREYNEAKVKAALYHSKASANLSTEKAYLKELILKSLKQFHEDRFTDSVLYNKLVQIEILYEKGLFKMGYELINRSIRLAEKHEKFLIHAQLLLWKINYDIKFNTLNFISPDSETATRKVNDFLVAMNYKMKFQELFLLTTTDITKDTKLIKQTIHKLKPIIHQPVPKSNLGAYYYYATLSFIAVLENNTRNMIHYFEKGLNIFKKNHLFSKEEPNLFLNASNNFIFALIINNELQKAETEIADLQDTVNTLSLTIQQKARGLLDILDNKMLVLSKQDKWNAAHETAKETERSLPLLDKYIDLPRRMYLYFSISNAHFFSKNFKLTNKFLNRIIKSKEEKEADKDLIAFAMLIQLATMIESKELLLFKSKLITTRNYIKQQFISPWLLMFCDFLSIKERKKASERNSEKELKKKLIAESAQDAALKRLFGSFDLIKWLNSLHP